MPEDYSWLVRGLEPPVQPEYIAQKERNALLAAEEEEKRQLQAALAEQERQRQDQWEVEAEKRLRPTLTGISRDAPQTFTPEQWRIIETMPFDQWDDEIRETISGYEQGMVGQYQEGGVVPEPSALDRIIRQMQELSLSGLRNLPEPIKKPVRQAVGRVATNVIEPHGYGKDVEVNKVGDIAALFAPRELPRTLSKIYQDQPAYRVSEDPEAEEIMQEDVNARRPLFREYFDLPTQDVDQVYTRHGKNFRINPETENPVARHVLKQFEGDVPGEASTNMLSRSYVPGQPDLWDFAPSAEELEKTGGRHLDTALFGRMLFEAIGRPAVLETGGYQSGGVVPQSGGTTMDGITMGPARSRRRPDMMQNAIGMKAAVPTIPYPGGNPSGITMGGRRRGLGAVGGSYGDLPGGQLGGGGGSHPIGMSGYSGREMAPLPDIWGGPGGGGGGRRWHGGGGTNQLLPLAGGNYGAGTNQLLPLAGSTDTVPAMLTPGEGVLNRGAMQMIGEGPVNALNRYGRGMEEGGIVEDDDEYPTAEESKNWTEKDWAAWRRKHPRFDDPTPTPVEHYQHGTGHAGGGRRERPVGPGGGASRFRGMGNLEDQFQVSEWLTGKGYPPGYYENQGPPAGNPMPVDIPPAHDFADLPEGGRIPRGGGGGSPSRGGLLGGGGDLGGGLGGIGGIGGLPIGSGGTGRSDLMDLGRGYVDVTEQGRRNWLDKQFPGRGNPSANLAEGGIVPGYAEGTPSVEIPGGGPISSGGPRFRSTWADYLDQLGTADFGSPGGPSFSGFQHQYQNRPAPPVYAPGMVPGETLGVADKMRLGGGYQGPGYGWAPQGGPGWSPFPGAGAGSPGMGGSLSALAGMPSQGFNFKPWLDKMFPGRTQATAGVATGGIVMEDGVVPSFQEGGVVPIGYSAPIEEQEWQKLVQFVPANVDIAKLREQADKSGISADTLMKLFSSMGGAGSGGGTSSGYGSGPIGGWVGYGG